MKLKLMAAVCAFGLIAVFLLLPARKANLDYVGSAASLMVLKKVNDDGTFAITEIKVQPAANSDEALVSAHVMKVKAFLAGGVLADRETDFNYSARTKSYCLELQSGCLAIEQERMSQSVSVKIPL